MLKKNKNNTAPRIIKFEIIVKSGKFSNDSTNSLYIVDKTYIPNINPIVDGIGDIGLRHFFEDVHHFGL